MRRVATIVVSIAALALGAAGLAATTNSGAPEQATKVQAKNLTVWVGWSARELGVFKSVVAEYDKKHPEVTIKVLGGINDDKITAGIRSGNVPDVVSSFTSANVGTYCSSGGWIDLAPLLKDSNLSAAQFPEDEPVLHAVQREAVRAAAPRRRVRALLQQEALQGGRDQEPAEDVLGADRRREEADEEGSRRLDQGRGLRLVPRLLRRQRARPLHVCTALRGEVRGLEGQVLARHEPRLGEDPEVAEEPRRLLRVQEPRQVPCRQR